jgi:hypothetical protein
VVDEEAPASVDSSQIETWLAEKLDGTHPEFGRPDEETIYLVIYPPWTTLIWGSASTCGGYHGDLQVDGKAVYYAAIADCAPEGQIDSMGSTISHELIETATDPNPSSPSLHGYVGMDADHLAWQLFYTTFLGIPADELEISDLCGIGNAPFPGPSNMEARAWSNSAIRAGHAPCVPAISDRPYFNAVPIVRDDVDVTRGPLPMVHTKGVIVPLGESRTIEVDLYSDQEMPAPWSVSAEIAKIDSMQQAMSDAGDDAAPDAAEVAAARSSDLEFTFDRTTGANGEKLHVTITRIRPAALGSSIAVLRSTSNGYGAIWPFVVGQ